MARREAPARVVERVGRRVAELRREQGWTQESLAERLGITIQRISRIEAGGANMTIETLVGLAHVLDVDVVELFTTPAPGRARKPRADKGQRRD
jgi:transcriptional regulator with XRE-family HTH domain